MDDVFGLGSKPCPVCRGTGELDLQIPQDRIITCKHCAGRGIIQQSPLELAGRICPSCKGLGVLERPIVCFSSPDASATVIATVPRPTQFEYDVAISFAGEDRPIVQPYAEELQRRHIRLFYADFAQVDLWGADLYETFDAIYRLKARYCVLFLSRHYAAKVWTNHERKAAQARAVLENQEYILPVRLDATELPGLRPTIGYLDWAKVGLNGLVEATIKKLSK
ncbi:MAG: TIR domain-containing protein [Firmicutes bacterium]|nr:TIR domain-containing protein [Bacillota bacterium]